MTSARCLRCWPGSDLCGPVGRATVRPVACRPASPGDEVPALGSGPATVLRTHVTSASTTSPALFSIRVGRWTRRTRDGHAPTRTYGSPGSPGRQPVAVSAGPPLGRAWALPTRPAPRPDPRRRCADRDLVGLPTGESLRRQQAAGEGPRQVPTPPRFGAVMRSTSPTPPGLGAQKPTAASNARTHTRSARYRSVWASSSAVNADERINKIGFGGPPRSRVPSATPPDAAFAQYRHRHRATTRTVQPATIAATGGTAHGEAGAQRCHCHGPPAKPERSRESPRAATDPTSSTGRRSIVSGRRPPDRPRPMQPSAPVREPTGSAPPPHHPVRRADRTIQHNSTAIVNATNGITADFSKTTVLRSTPPSRSPRNGDPRCEPTAPRPRTPMPARPASEDSSVRRPPRETTAPSAG